MLAVPLMSEEALLKIIGALDNYKAELVKAFDLSDYCKVQNELLALGLDGHEAEFMLMHPSTISTFQSEMVKGLNILKKLATIREDRAKKITLLETKKKELAETEAHSASLKAEIAELQKE